MPEFDYEEMKKEAEQYIKFEKDKRKRIAYITFDRPEAHSHRLGSEARVPARVAEGGQMVGERSYQGTHPGPPRR